MNLLNSAKLTRAVEHLAVMLEIKKRTDEEDALALLLLALLDDYYQDGDIDLFVTSFLATLRVAYEELDPDGIYAGVIDEELATQEGFLRGFAAGLENGDVSEKQARARINQYSASLGKMRVLIQLENAENDGDSYLTWQWNALLEIERHCNSCKGLNGRREKASTWKALNLYPRSLELDCGQFCQCDFLKG
jgi:hypothetical protein